MTSRADLPRLGASLGVLGTLVESQQAWDTSWGWAYGPRPAPARGERGGGGTEVDVEDRKAEEKARGRAAQIHDEYRAWCAEMDALTQRGLRLHDVIQPPHPAALRNRSGDLDPITAADAAAAGWCKSCWRNDQQMVPTTPPEGSGRLKRYRDYCRWCGDFHGQHKIEPPIELLRIRHAGGRISEQDVDKAIKAALQAAKPKKTKRKKGKVAA